MTLEADVCIVGSGAGGGVLAHSLTRAGFSVILLEKGGEAPRDSSAQDELLQVIRRFHVPSLEQDGTVVVEKEGETGAPTRVGQAYYLVGGGTILYAAVSWRLRGKDLRKLSEYGPVTGAELVDWPIDYDELEPWYTMAEKEIGVSGRSGADPTEPPRSADHLMPPLTDDPCSRLLEAGARKMGHKPFPLPMAIGSRPASGRRSGRSPIASCRQSPECPPRACWERSTI